MSAFKSSQTNFTSSQTTVNQNHKQIHTNFVSITAMPAVNEKKSLEELRWEDSKQAEGGGQALAGAFGQTSSTNAFGQSGFGFERPVGGGSTTECRSRMEKELVMLSIYAIVHDDLEAIKFLHGLGADINSVHPQVITRAPCHCHVALLHTL